jgi:hypothetical protein
MPQVKNAYRHTQGLDTDSLLEMVTFGKCCYRVWIAFSGLRFFVLMITVGSLGTY